jgi:electron transfer flavoprotein beta subunit
MPEASATEGSFPRRAAVVLATIADPKWATISRAFDPADTTMPRKLSPFDEAALEVGLKLRDAQPGLEVAALVVGGRECEPVVRSIAALRPNRTLRLDLPTSAMWNTRGAAFQIKAALAASGDFDLVLLGREFGDFDDGAIPPFLAAAMGTPFLGLIQRGRIENGGVELIRDRAGAEEQARFSSPVVASVTNDKSNRLRHPLLKAVMAARQEPLVVLPPQDFVQPSPVYAGSSPVEETRRGGDGHFIEGPPEAQAAELAALLLRWKEAV